MIPFRENIFLSREEIRSKCAMMPLSLCFFSHPIPEHKRL